MRNERGNIILTALFVAVFLFFLSIALIWTNRQDIALSLTMEHKMKGEAAARSAAMMAYASLRDFDKPLSESEGTLPSGATWKVELVELPAEPRREAALLVRARGTSGPLSSYFTMHLLKSQLGDTLKDGEGRMLGFLEKPKPAVPVKDPLDASVTAEQAPSDEASSSASKGTALYSDFELKELDLAVNDSEGFVAYQGPLFTTTAMKSEQSPMAAIDYIPILDPNGLAIRASGPAVILAPKLETENVLSVLRYKKEALEWSPIPFPVDLTVEVPDPPPTMLLQTEGPKSGAWNSIGIRVVGEIGTSYHWRDNEPATYSDAEATDLGLGVRFEPDLGNTPEWSAVKRVPPQRGYALRGAIAAYKEAVYSHGWEYLYLRYSGRIVTDPIPQVAGSSITRWPCLRKYDSESQTWSTVWSSLKDNGDVASEIVPDPSVLVVDSQDRCYSRTLSTPQRLLEFEPRGKIKVGEKLTGGQLFVYQDEPYTLSDDPSKPGFLNLKSKKVLGFSGMLSRIPEISGMTITEIPGEMVDNGTSELEVSDSDGAGSLTSEMRTTRCEYNLEYQIDPASNVACDGKDLYTNILIKLEKRTPSYPFYGTFDLKEPTGPVLARYDGEQWHVLPNGLMAALTTPLATPGSYLFCAHYAGMPGARSRYTVLAIDVDPFEFNQ